MSEGWKAAQDRLRSRIWVARAARGGEDPMPAPVSALLQAPELVAPAIASHRPFVGLAIRVLKRTLHRLLVPLVFVPQAEFNLRVAARLNEGGWTGDFDQRIQEIDRRIQEVTESLGELRGDVLAVRAELQSQQLLLEKVSQPTKARDAAGTGAG